jgi:hypothetical protein
MEIVYCMFVIYFFKLLFFYFKPTISLFQHFKQSLLFTYVQKIFRQTRGYTKVMTCKHSNNYSSSTGFCIIFWKNIRLQKCMLGIKCVFHFYLEILFETLLFQ